MTSKIQPKLRVIVVGGGIAGLATARCLGSAGHRVTVLERSSEISEIGAGIQISPNISRLFARWGLGQKLKDVAVVPKYLTLHRYDTGSLLAYTAVGDQMEQDYGAPYCQIHRKDLIRILHDAAAPYMDLRLSSDVVEVSASGPSVMLDTGEVLHGDVIFGADGIRGVVRNIVSPGFELQYLDDVAYRLTLPTAALERNPQLHSLIKEPHTRCWLGPGRHIVAYPVSKGEIYNLVLVAPDVDASDSWNERADLSEVRSNFSGWEPCVQKVIDSATLAYKTKVAYGIPPDNWSFGNVALVGDACHSMPPYRAQAAAMAIEDAASLGVLFASICCMADIPHLLKGYQEIRKPRIKITLEASLSNRTVFHLPDGEAQRRRDDSLRMTLEDMNEESQEKRHHGNANQWADKKRNDEQFLYDAEAVTKAWIKSSKL